MRRYKGLGIGPNAFLPDSADVKERAQIAELIAYTPDANGWGELKFLVEVDADQPKTMMGGVRETYDEYISRKIYKDYVEKTLDLAKA